MIRVLKWPVPVDGRPHSVGGGPIAMVGHQQAVDEIYVWTIEDSTARNDSRTVQVFATGEPILGVVEHLGSTAMPVGLVWHVFQVHP